MGSRAITANGIRYTANDLLREEARDVASLVFFAGSVGASPAKAEGFNESEIKMAYDFSVSYFSSSSFMLGAWAPRPQKPKALTKVR